MSYAADLHLHSYFARGTSKELTFENLARWARIKGIDLLVSADFTHPAWFDETRRKLAETGDGLYEFDETRFILGTEVNCVAEQGGKGRRIHMLLFAPGLDTVERINKALAEYGNLPEDGRPTLLLSPADLVKLVLGVDERCFAIPAHAWTPWYGVFGSKSGFDSLSEAFGDVRRHIFAIETGLSSDPAMNWRVPELDDIAIVSFSDAHSLPRTGRELTVFNGEPSYDALVQALKTQDIAYTVEFFPEEGKYHYSGHRACGISYSPEELERYGRRCPVCGRRLTVGVMQRVEELARRQLKLWTDDMGFTRSDDNRPPFKSLVGLQQIVAEALGVGVSAKRVQTAYTKLVESLGPELTILLEAQPADIAAVAGDRVAEGVVRVRKGDIYIEPGYDGLYGKVQVWPDAASSADVSSEPQTSMALNEDSE